VLKARVRAPGKRGGGERRADPADRAACALGVATTQTSRLAGRGRLPRIKRLTIAGEGAAIVGDAGEDCRLAFPTRWDEHDPRKIIDGKADRGRACGGRVADASHRPGPRDRSFGAGPRRRGWVGHNPAERGSMSASKTKMAVGSGMRSFRPTALPETVERSRSARADRAGSIATRWCMASWCSLPLPRPHRTPQKIVGRDRSRARMSTASAQPIAGIADHRACPLWCHARRSAA